MKKIIAVIFLLCFSNEVFTQGVETYAGDKRFGVDVMWFKNFKNKEEENSPFLFFSRNRANANYDNEASVFGSTNAISYNLKNGLGVVFVGSFQNNGFTPKLGVQYVKTKKDFMFFGWIVAGLKKNPGADLFGMFRYQPALSKKMRLFSQVELFPIYNFKDEFWNITERLRGGIKLNKTSFGLMTDFNQSGKKNLTPTENTGVFLRHEF